MKVKCLMWPPAVILAVLVIAALFSGDDIRRHPRMHQM
jgi:hypothetical protein